jgi:hypothetical protein
LTLVMQSKPLTVMLNFPPPRQPLNRVAAERLYDVSVGWATL